MVIELGIVKKYIRERGFGFVRTIFNGEDNYDVFFHIKEINKSNNDLAHDIERISSEKEMALWFEVAVNKKGRFLKRVVEKDAALEYVKNNVEKYSSFLESVWEGYNFDLPGWLSDLSVVILGEDNFKFLMSDRSNTLRFNLQSNISELEYHRNNIMLMDQSPCDPFESYDDVGLFLYEDVAPFNNDSNLKEQEFLALVEEIKKFNYTLSSQISRYIRDNKLGTKYPNISGILEMQSGDYRWRFDGGFPPDIFARLCSELGVSGKGTNSRVVGFKAYKDIK